MTLYKFKYRNRQGSITTGEREGKSKESVRYSIAIEPGNERIFLVNITVWNPLKEQEPA